MNNCGGVGLMHCISNCRVLEPLNVSMATNTLKSHAGQDKLYVKPIQKNLSVISIGQDHDTCKICNCQICQTEFLLQDLKETT